MSYRVHNKAHHQIKVNLEMLTPVGYDYLETTIQSIGMVKRLLSWALFNDHGAFKGIQNTDKMPPAGNLAHSAMLVQLCKLSIQQNLQPGAELLKGAHWHGPPRVPISH